MRILIHFVIFLAGYLIIPQGSFAQISFDNNSAATNSAGTGNSVAVTVPMGNDRLLVAAIGTNDQTNTPTVTFNGMNMVLAVEDKDDFNTTYNSRVLIYYLALGSGTTEIANTITATGLDNYYTIGGMSFQNIDQSSPVKQTAVAPIPTGNINTSQIATSITGVTAGNLLFAFLGEDNVQQFEWGGTYIAGGTHMDSGLNGDGYYYASYNANAAAGDHTFTYDINNGIQSCAGILIEFAQKLDLPSVSIAVSNSSVAENGGANLDYTFTVTPAPTSDLTVNFEISGTAEDDDDFTVSTPSSNNETVSYTTKAGAGNNAGTITIKSGQTSGVLRITPTSDSDVEANETIIVTITN